ncbi:MAG: cyclopropane-fatty-acyl-phospholipid synthase family protein [Kofleriaceae bacterium]
MAELAHPLIAPLPRLISPAGRLLRWTALERLRAVWRGPRLDLVLPSGERVQLGDGPAAVSRATIHDDRLFLRMLWRGEMGAGESFVAGEWSSDDLVATLRAFLAGTRARGFESPLTRLAQLPALVCYRRGANSRTGSKRNIHAHYDLGNAFYRLFLDPETLSYSCGVFATATSLAAAQHAKHERLCELLQLDARDHLLEIGCGWGGMAIHAARTRGCRVTAITVSREQHALATARVAEAGLADRIAIEYRDYREPLGMFSKIVSIEMLEAVGYAFLPGFFTTLARALAPGGRIALQTITMPDDRFEAYRTRVDWMQTYIFPGSCIPSLAAIRGALVPSGLAITHADDIGPDYTPTLRTWRERFVAELTAVRALGFDEPFIRTWLLYLAFSEAAFAERTLGDHQLVLQRLG